MPFSLPNKKWLLIVVFLLGIFLFVTLEFFGLIWHNAIFAFNYPVKGLDISHHQGKIDWQKVAATHRYQFVFIKATEGHDFVDNSFSDNWRQAKNHGFLVGAYHFFSTRSSGQEQARLFMATVPQDSSALPPVIDIEIDLNKNKNQIRAELKNLATALAEHYQKRPILYVTYDSYRAYVDGDFPEYQIWIRDTLKPPSLPNRQWLIWQYNNRGRVPGIDTYVDINAVNGKLE